MGLLCISFGTMRKITETPRELCTKKVWDPLLKANHVFFNPVSCFPSFLPSKGDRMTQFQAKQKCTWR